MIDGDKLDCYRLFLFYWSLDYKTIACFEHQLAPRVIPIFYHNIAAAVKDFYDISLRVVHIEICVLIRILEAPKFARGIVQVVDEIVRARLLPVILPPTIL